MNNSNQTKFLGIGLLVLLPFLLIALFQPVDISRDNCKQITGIVEQIAEGTSYDIFFRLKDNPNRYYINRGLERGLTLPTLQQQLLGKEIDLWHAQSWQTSGGHITQVQIGEEVVYSEWEE